MDRVSLMKAATRKIKMAQPSPTAIFNTLEVSYCEHTAANTAAFQPGRCFEIPTSSVGLRARHQAHLIVGIHRRREHFSHCLVAHFHFFRGRRKSGASVPLDRAALVALCPTTDTLY